MTGLHDLRDAFDVQDATLWSWGASATVLGGRLSLTGQYLDRLDELELAQAQVPGEVQSTATYDLTGSYLATELVYPGSTASAQTWAGIFTDNPRRNAALWRIRYEPLTGAVELQAVVRVDGAESILQGIPLWNFPDATERDAHRWLQVREYEGTVYFETSPDGRAWTMWASSWTASWDLTAVRAVLGCSYESPGEPSPPVAEFGHVNIMPAEKDPVTITGNPGDPCLAVDVMPDNLTDTFQVDRSVLDGPERLAWSAIDPGSWQNIVCDVTRLGYRRGATRLQGVLTQTEAGAVTITLSDTSRTFDPLSNPGAIRKGTPLRIRAWGHDTGGLRWDAVLFTGEVDELSVRYLKDEAPVVTVTGLDLVGPLNAWQSEGRPQPGDGAGDNLLQRAQRILVETGRGELSPDSDQEYVATLAPAIMARPWQELNAATEAELGRLWVDRHGQLVVRARGSQLTGPVRGTLSDIHGEAPLGAHCCVADAAVVYGVESMANRVLGGRRKLATEGAEVAPQLVRRDDEASQRLHGVGTVERTSLELQTDDQVAAWAGQLVTMHTNPELRVDSVTPLPSPVDLDSALDAWPAVLQTDLGDRWAFRYHPTVGPVVDRGLGVLGVELEATPDGWSVVWTTEDAPIPGRENPSGWFLLDLSELDSGDVLAPYAAHL